MRVPAGFALAAILSITCSCADLRAIEHDVCGNGVVDPHEDCDTFPNDPTKALSCGAPDSVAACQYVVTDPSACPSGFRAGLDLVCRKQTSGFKLATELPGALGTRPEVADFDGDGIGDLTLLTPDRFQREVDYMSELGIRATLDLSALPGEAAAIADVDGDGLADVVGPTFAGITTFTGVGDETFSPELYARATTDSAYAKFIALPARLSGKPQTGQAVYDVAAWFTADPGGPGVRLCLDALDASCASSVSLPNLAPASLAMTTFHFVDLGDPLPSLAYAVDDGQSTSIFVATWQAVPLGISQIVELKLPQTHDLLKVGAIQGSLVVTDVDADGRDDLVVAAKVGPTKTRTNLFAFHGKNIAAWTAADALDPIEDSLDLGGKPLLAAGRFNEDDVPDYVSATQVWLSVPNDAPLAPHQFVKGPSSGLNLDNGPTWSSAVVGDFNRDGLDDVALTPPSPGIDLFFGAKGLLELSPYRLSADTTVGSPVATDLDGDGVTDLVVSTNVHPKCDAPEELLAYYGRTSDGPDGPHVLAEITGTIDVGAAHFAGDAIGDLAVLFQPPDGTGKACGTGVHGGALLGSSDRQVSSPFALSGISVPLSLAVGPAPDGSSVEIVASTTDLLEHAVTFLSRPGPGQLAEGLSAHVGAVASHDYAAALVVGDGGDPILFTPRPAITPCGASCDMNLEVSRIAAADGTVQTIDLGAVGATIATDAPQSSFMESLRAVRTTLDRVPGEGSPASDYVVVARIPQKSKPAATPDAAHPAVPQNLFLFHGASLTPERPALADPILDFTMIADATGAMRLVAVTATTVYVRDAKDGSLRAIYSLRGLHASSTDSADPSLKITGVASGDVDGDQLTDLVLVTTHGTRVFSRLDTVDRDRPDLSL